MEVMLGEVHSCWSLFLVSWHYAAVLLVPCYLRRECGLGLDKTNEVPLTFGRLMFACVLKWLFAVSELEALVVNCSAETSTPLASSCGSRLPNLDISEDRMRRKLRFFFMNPIEKWQARRKFPYKFFVQVVKIILVTVQVRWYCHRSAVFDFIYWRISK